MQTMYEQVNAIAKLNPIFKWKHGQNYMERLKLTGIAYNDEQVKFGLGPRKETSLIDFGNNVLIFRPIEGEIGTSSGKKIILNPKDEIERRTDAYYMYTSYLPNYTQPTSHVILQGEGGDNPQEERSIPVLGRFTPKLENVRSITEISDEEVIMNLSLCQALCEINRQFLKIILEKGIVADTGEEGNFGKDCFGHLYNITRKLTHGNVMIGQEKSGKEKIFLDPDWYIYLGEDGQNSYLQKTKRVAILITRIAFFGVMIFFNKFHIYTKEIENSGRRNVVRR